MITVYGLAAFRPELKGLVRDIRVVWTLEELGMMYQRKVMDATKGEHKAPEYLAVNPFGKVPAIQDQDFTLYESSAICAYLGDKAGKLLPKSGTKERAVYDQWVSFVTASFEPLTTRVIWMDLHAPKNDVATGLRKEYLTAVDTMAAAIDKQLSKKPYILGEAFSLVDIQLASVCRIVGHTEVLARHSHLGGYLEKCFARPAFEKALENNG